MTTAGPGSGPLRRILRGTAGAVRARPGVFLGVAVAVLVLYVALPLAVLSLVRKPVDFFTFNPWLPKLPAFLVARDVPLARKIAFVPGLVLFWFSADSPFGGPEWGFAVDMSDLVRFAVMAFLFGTYFALWFHQRVGSAPAGWRPPVSSRAGGMAGAVTSVLGFSTGPCSVVGCGAPVLPVVGLAFAGLTSGTLAVLASLSRVATTVVFVALVACVAYLGWRAGAGPPGRDQPAP